MTDRRDPPSHNSFAAPSPRPGVSRKVGPLGAPGPPAAVGRRAEPRRFSEAPTVDLTPVPTPAERGLLPGATRPAPGPTHAPQDPELKKFRSSPRGEHRYRQPDSRNSRSVTGPVRGKGGRKRGRRRKATFWRDLPMLVVSALVLTVLLQTLVARVYEIPSPSMETTLHGCTGCTNDRVLVDKLSYRFGQPSPGDVVVFHGPPTWLRAEGLDPQSTNALVSGLRSMAAMFGLVAADKTTFIKRVIAVGGQTVACCDAQNRVTVDGRALNEPYLYYAPEAGPAIQADFGPVTVQPGQLWVMGDNRNDSADSRALEHFGPILTAEVIGKARYVILPLTRLKTISSTGPQRR
jgi:signal peptidase I